MDPNRVLHRSPEELAAVMPGRTEASWRTPATLLARMAAAYRCADATQAHEPDRVGFWENNFREHQGDAHTALLAADIERIRALWEAPAKSMVFFGFAETTKQAFDAGAADGAAQEFRARQTYDALLRLGEAAGVVRVVNPEPRRPPDLPPGPEEVLEGLDRALGVAIDFPNPYEDTIGLKTSRGVATVRAINSLYQAWRIAELAAGGPVLEIGAGLGMTCYYACRLGVIDYTIVDLAFTNASQAHFLGQVLGENAISLSGEPAAAPVRIIPAAELDRLAGTFALAANFDSLPEMSLTAAKQYLRTIVDRAPLFVSANHELNANTVRTLLRELAPAAAVSRSLYWPRKGYVEEVADFSGDSGRPRGQATDAGARLREAHATIDRLQADLAKTHRELGEARRILASRSRTFRRWLELLGSKRS
jgi:hypothetical protein